MAMTLITTNTSSNAASSSFTSSIDSTYKLYIFKFYDVNPATDEVQFQFNGSDDTSSHSYDITKTTTWIETANDEQGNSIATNYRTSNDLAQSTSFSDLTRNLSYDADSSSAGTLWLFNPSNTTYVKHFMSDATSLAQSNPVDYVQYSHSGGYFNTTAAITAIQFKMSSGNMDAVIKMYGVG